MAEDRQTTDLVKSTNQNSSQKSPREKKLSVAQADDLFSMLPKELKGYVLEKLYTSTVTFLILRVNRFFSSLVTQFILTETPKRTLINLFRPKNEKSKPAQERFRQLMAEYPGKLSLAETHLPITAFGEFPLEHVDLKGADCMGVKFSSIQKTDLWNRIEIDILNKRYFTAQSAWNFWFDLYAGEFTVSCVNSDLVEHCILYNLVNFPIDLDLKQALKFRFYNQFCGLTESKSVSDFINEHPLFSPRGAYDRFSDLQFCLLIKIEKKYVEKFKAWCAEIAKCFPTSKTTFLNGDYQFFATDSVQNEQEEIERFMLVLRNEYAFRLYVTHPLAVAMRLVETWEHLFANDVIETCDLLLQESKKFKGFDKGIPDAKINEIQASLENFKKTASLMRSIGSSIDAKGGYKNLCLLELKNHINKETLPDANKLKLLEFFENKKLACIIKTIEDGFKADDKKDCLKLFKEQFNQAGLSVKNINVLFNHFKNTKILNQHRNPVFDSIFGIKNTKSWRDTWKEIRDDAKVKLFSELDLLPDKQAKTELLNEFKNQPLFANHRNNFFFEGAFCRTQAIKDIEEKHASLR